MQSNPQSASEVIRFNPLAADAKTAVEIQPRSAKFISPRVQRGLQRSLRDDCNILVWGVGSASPSPSHVCPAARRAGGWRPPDTARGKYIEEGEAARIEGSSERAFPIPKKAQVRQ